MNKIKGITDNDYQLLKEKYDNLEPIIEKLNNNYPVQYLIGNVSFYGYNINVDERVLIPRFETEYLVEKTIDLIRKKNVLTSKVLEVGTGSGCISIALKKEIPSLNITAIDISNDALDLEKSNALENQVDIKFLNEDLFNYQPQEKADILISNPPYISCDEVIDPKTKYEPQNALYADDLGMKYYKYMIDNYERFLNEKFIMAFEIGYLQGESLLEYTKDKLPKSIAYVEKDLSGKDRYLFIINE